MLSDILGGIGGIWFSEMSARARLSAGGGGGVQKLFGIGASLLKVLETLACQKEACVKYS